MISELLIEEFTAAANSPDEADLAPAALVIPRVEYLDVDPAPSLAELVRLGSLAESRRMALGPMASRQACIAALNQLLFEEERFTPNEVRYDDPQNNFLNDVIRRRTGIPITLSLIYLDVARRAGIPLEGVNFPGHFLVRSIVDGDELLIDPYHGGVLLTDADCQQLLVKQFDGELTFSRALLVTANKRQILTRVLSNLKRLYVRFRSFPQARDVTCLLAALDPGSAIEIRDRGLLSYQLHDYRRALRDLETYLLHLAPMPATAVDDETRREHEQIWDHVKTLRRRLAAFN
jgi:regulator of sirC expression with transglutaminase-like and TPR domain